MSIASLISPYNEGFTFDHDQLHRRMRAAQASGALTAILDPLQTVNLPAGPWNLNHAQLHQDFALAFPAILWPSTSAIADVDLVTGADEFWAFQNRNLHNMALTQLTPSG